VAAWLFDHCPTARRSAAALLAALASVGVATLSGCLGGDHGSSDALHASSLDARLEGAVKVERIVYSSSDGRRVPALFAVPRAVTPRGCLIWENGPNFRPEDSAEVWDGAARLGLAVFTVKLRGHGKPADPSRLAAMVRGSVVDLTRGIDYLEQRPECRQNIGYVGVSLGGAIGSVLAGRDPRIRATVLISTPPTWRSLLLAQGVKKTRLRTVDGIQLPLDPERWIARISPRPVLVPIGRQDALVLPSAAAQTESAARPPKRIVSFRDIREVDAAFRPLKGSLLTADFLVSWLVKPSYQS
jgi:pimeloyl-ACP methyl ester carboxylesterase